jgi:hypothetical protein
MDAQNEPTLSIKPGEGYYENAGQRLWADQERSDAIQEPPINPAVGPIYV